MYPSYPLGIGYLASEIADRGHQVKIIDLRIESFDSLCETVKHYQPEIIGMSIFTNTVTSALKTLHDIRHLSNAVLICGGIHATVFYKDMLRAGFDYVIGGESENAMVEFIQTLESGKLVAMPDVRDKNGTDATRPEPSSIPVDINRLSLLNRSFFNLNLYRQHTLIASRGCLYSCKYCGYSYHKPLRIRRVEDVLKELVSIVEMNCPKEVFFVDNILLGSNWKKIKALCKGISAHGIKIDWVAQLRPDHLDEDGLSLMKQAGCSSIYFGIESGSQAALSRIGRQMDINKAIDGVLMAKRHGLFVKSGFIIGLPGAYAEQLNSLELIDRARPNSVSFHMLVPYPGTELFEEREKYGIHIRQIRNWDTYDLYQASPNIVYDYLPPDKIKSLIDTIQKHLESLAYQSGHSSSHQEKGIENYYYSLPYCYHGH